jgi:hypothetical protein
VRIERRVLWVFVKRRRIPFDWIRAVTYGYADWSFSQWFAQAFHTLDVFRVGLRLKDDTERHFFTFFGEGTFKNDSVWADWVHGEKFFVDLSGTQERESRVFVELLSKLIGVGVVPPGN